jgi:hypothetical protein
MKHIPILLSALALAVALAVSTSAFPQNETKSPTPENGVGMGQAGKSAPSAAAAGVRSAGGDTLMQQREKGMSPESASDATGGKAATGKMKQ